MDPRRKALEVKRIALLAVFAAGMLAACHRAPTSAPSSPSPSPSAAAANAEGIAWFEGGLDAAFATAAAQHKLVFLYWGAEWCPPCHDLKAHVFSRRDFQDKLRQFVPVHLDGDAPGAQRAGESFHVLGYPTVVVLTADRQEVARIAGGGDLGSYADVLDLALENVQPLPQLLASLQADASRALSDAECRRLAWNGWELDPRQKADELSAALQLAASRCPAAAAAERDRLTVTAAELQAGSERAAIESGKAPGARLATLLDAVDALLADRARALRSGDALMSLGEDFFVVVRTVRAARVDALRDNWFALMDAIEQDGRYGDSTQLDSAAKRLQAAKALDRQGHIPADVAARARATLDAYLARDYDTDTRSGVINSAEWVLTYLDDKPRLRKLLEGEIATSKTPYYYMADLADLEEQQGNKAAALELLARAYRESTGPATRFQWGALYVQGLLRMSPHDEVRIRAATLEVIGELAGPDRIHARARARLEKLDAALGTWARTTKNPATLEAVAVRWHQLCAALPATDPVRQQCPALLAARTTRI